MLLIDVSPENQVQFLDLKTSLAPQIEIFVLSQLSACDLPIWLEPNLAEKTEIE